jgi:hypothetical protein
VPGIIATPTASVIVAQLAGRTSATVLPSKIRRPDGPAEAWLQKGDFEKGWQEYEWRWKRKQTPPRPFRQLVWDGSPLSGRTILLYMEQGLGDMLQIIRYAPLVKERGGAGTVL